MLDGVIREIGKFYTSFIKIDILQLSFVMVWTLTASFLSHKIIDIIFHSSKKHFKKGSISEERLKRRQTIGKILKTIIDIGLWAYAIISFLTLIGIDVPSLMTGAGLVGVVIGLGAQNTVRDIVAGIFIVIENQYRVGDSIETMIGGREIAGKVENITLRITQIRDTSGRLHTIRNGASEAITNMSFKYANVNMAIGVSYSTDIDKLEEVINRIGEEMMEREDLKEQIIDPIKFTRINQFLDSSMEIKSVGRVKAGSQWYVAGEFRRLLKEAFDKNDIEIPFPQMVIHDSKEKFPEIALKNKRKAPKNKKTKKIQ